MRSNNNYIKFISIVFILLVSCKVKENAPFRITELDWMPPRVYPSKDSPISVIVDKRHDTIYHYLASNDSLIGISVKVPSYDNNLYFNIKKENILHTEIRNKTTIIIHRIDTFTNTSGFTYTKYIFIKKLSKYESAYNKVEVEIELDFNCTKTTLSQIIDSLYNLKFQSNDHFRTQNGNTIVSSKVGDIYNKYRLNYTTGFYLIEEPYKNGYRYKKLYSKKTLRYLRKFNADRIPPVPLNKLVVPKN